MLASGEEYEYGGGAGNVFFIRYAFDDCVTHLVRVPKLHQGAEMTRRYDQPIRVMKTFPLTFTHGSVLFDPRKPYPVLDEAEGRLLLEIPGEGRQIEVDSNRFKIRRQLVFQRNPTAEEPDPMVGSAAIDACLAAHPPW